jgi:predicted enzyme related to lactoylglutathione lyase
MCSAMLIVIRLASIIAYSIMPLALLGQEAPSAAIFSDANIILSVSDVRKSVAFYETVLEFKLEKYLVGSAKEVTTLSPSDPEPYAAAMLAGTQRINLEKSMNPPMASGARYTFHVKDVAAYYDRIVKRGVSVKLIAKDTDGKPFWFSVVDPDGHWYMFIGPIGNR